MFDFLKKPVALKKVKSLKLPDQDIILGAVYKDVVTGCQGVATAFVQYITGCNQVSLAQKVDSEGKTRPNEWFDVQRLQKISEEPLVLDNSEAPGFDSPPPHR
jgi:hypothetical protein